MVERISTGGRRRVIWITLPRLVPTQSVGLMMPSGEKIKDSEKVSKCRANWVVWLERGRVGASCKKVREMEIE